jgi:hypothetical protein
MVTLASPAVGEDNRTWSQCDRVEACAKLTPVAAVGGGRGGLGRQWLYIELAVVEPHVKLHVGGLYDGQRMPGYPGREPGGPLRGDDRRWRQRRQRYRVR